MKYETQLFGGQTNLHCMKQILHNAKSNSHGCIRLAICIATAFAVVMLTACSDGNGTKSFHSSDEAIWKSHSTLTLLATQDLPTFLYYMIDPLKSWCWGAILFYPFKNSRFS